MTAQDSNDQDSNDQQNRRGSQQPAPTAQPEATSGDASSTSGDASNTSGDASSTSGDASKRDRVPGASENLLRHAGQWRGAAPVQDWDPPHCGDMDMRIAADGGWYHEGTLIQRQSLVQLFSSILRLDGDGHHYLVTPVEKVRIQVEDCPFVAVLMDVVDQGLDSQVLRFTLNTGETVDAGPENPLQVDYHDNNEPHPIVEVRHGLKALISRSVFYDLAAIASIRDTSVDGNKYSKNNELSGSAWVLSKGQWYVLGPV